MARQSCRRFLATIIGLSLCMLVQPVLAQEPFYKGKSLRLVVNYPAGGATDVVARLLAQYLPKHIAGNPAVVVQNMPGGGGNVGANYVYEVAKPDGLTVGVFSGGYLPQVLGGSGVRFDLNNMPMIAGVGETSVVYIGADTGVKNPADILKPSKPIVIGGFTRESNKDLALRIALELLGVLGTRPQRTQMVVIRPQERGQDPRIEGITLGCAGAEPIASSVHGLRIDREHDHPVIEQEIDDAAVRLLDRGPQLHARRPLFVEPASPLGEALDRVRHAAAQDLRRLLVFDPDGIRRVRPIHPDVIPHGSSPLRSPQAWHAQSGNGRLPLYRPSSGRPPIEPRAVLSRSGTVPNRSFGGWACDGPHPRELCDLNDQSTRLGRYRGLGALSGPPS